jgi:fido (protein-threonine AMPylation protein)
MSGFEGFRDTPDAPFYRSGASSPERTWAEAAQRLSRVLNSATADAQGGRSQMTVERICGWHRAIFLTTFELDAGRIRSDLEPIAFSVPIEIEGEIRDVPMEGTRGQLLIVEEMRAACEVFNARLTSLQNREHAVEEAEGATAPAELYAAILRTHPFVDGNLRAAYIALAVALTAVGLPILEFRSALRRHDECLGWAMRADPQRTVAPLTQLIVELARKVDPATGTRYP